MCIFINARFLTQETTGVQRFSIEITKKLVKSNVNALVVTSQGVKDKVLAESLGARVIGKNTGHLWEQYDLPRFLKRNGNPLLLNLANTAPLFYDNKVSTIHDVAFERFPDSFSKMFQLAYHFAIPRIIKTSKKVITVSEFSKSEIVKLYGVKPGLIEVIYNAVVDGFEPKSHNYGEDYILAVSSLSKQKNFPVLIKAFNQIKNKEIKLYLVGSINKNFVDPNLVDAIDSNPNIKFLGRVSDEELVHLYSNAKCFVFPSLYEGFGIPPLEAQACGCPCVVSNSASLPEVCNDSALYFDPTNAGQLIDSIEEVINNHKKRFELINKGFENVARFSWSRSAVKVLEAVADHVK